MARLARLRTFLLRLLVTAVVLAEATHRAAGKALGLARAWREAHRTDWGQRRLLRKLSAHDAGDFTGKGIPRRDWRVFGDQLADLLWEVRTRERGGQQ